MDVSFGIVMAYVERCLCKYALAVLQTDSRFSACSTFHGASNFEHEKVSERVGSLIPASQQG